MGNTNIVIIPHTYNYQEYKYANYHNLILILLANGRNVF